MAWNRIVEVALAISIMINCLSIALFMTATNRLYIRANRILCLFLIAVCVKLSFALLVNFKHEWGTPSYILHSLTQFAYLCFGPLLFLYFRSIWNKHTKKSIIVLLFLPAFLPFIRFVFDFTFHLWFLQAYLLLLLVIIGIDLKFNSQAKNFKNPTDSEKKWINALFYSVIAVWFVVNLVLVNRKLYLLELMVIVVAVFYFDVFLAIKYYWVRKGDNKELHKYKNSALSIVEENDIVTRLEKLMSAEKLYLDPDLTLPKVASHLNVKPYKISQVINQKLNQTFNEYVNSYRIEDVKSALMSPENKDLKIACIAFDYGFNSISVFNNAFKKVENYTPSQFRNEFIMNNQN